MNRPELTNDEWDTLLDVLFDWGIKDEYLVANYTEVKKLQDKLADFYKDN